MASVRVFIRASCPLDLQDTWGVACGVRRAEASEQHALQEFLGRKLREKQDEFLVWTALM